MQVEVQDCNLAEDTQQSARVVLLNKASYDVRNNEECVITGFIDTITIKGKRLSFLFVGNTSDEGSGIAYNNSKNLFNTLTPEDEIKCARYIEEKEKIYLKN
jgi:hypothetical protein